MKRNIEAMKRAEIKMSQMSGKAKEYYNNTQDGSWVEEYNDEFIIKYGNGEEYRYSNLKKMGKAFVAFTFYAVSILSVGVSFMPSLLNHKHVSDPFLACIFGGLILGAGVGLVLRSNSSLDGTEILSIRLSKRWGFSVGEFIMFFNLFIFTAAGFVYNDWRSSMYSMISYFIAYRVIDIVIEGLNESKSVRIVTEKHTDIGSAIMENFDISVTYLKARGGYSGQEKRIIFCVINRLEIAKLKQLVKTLDESAFITIENVHEVDGGRVKKHGHI